MLGLAGVLTIAFVLLGVVAFATGIWLVVVAFKRSTMWGVLTLLVPFAALVFAIKFWPEARKPFLASVAAGVAASLLFFMSVGLAASAVSSDLAAQIAADPAMRDMTARMSSAARDAAEVQASKPAKPISVKTPAEPISVETPAEPAAPRGLEPAIVPPPDRKSPSKPVYDVDAISRDGFAPVALRDAAQLIGRRVKIVTTNGRVHRGEMLRADAQGLSLERWLRGGSAVLDFPKSEIESLQVEVN